MFSNIFRFFDQYDKDNKDNKNKNDDEKDDEYVEVFENLSQSNKIELKIKLDRINKVIIAEKEKFYSQYSTNQLST